MRKILRWLKFPWPLLPRVERSRSRLDLGGGVVQVAPILEDVISLRDGGELATWTGTSREVFAA
jgi:hypothetical protein